MALRASTLIVCLLLASAAAADTVYKYRRADGQTIYSNRLIPGAELIEAFEYQFTAPAQSTGIAPKSEAAANMRIQSHLAALDLAWSAVQEANRALAAAQARLAAGVAPFEEEAVSLAGPAKPAAPEAGGPQAPASPAAGGPSPVASPALGGPMGARRGGGRNADYQDRMAVLEVDVQRARVRLDAALRRYNELR